MVASALFTYALVVALALYGMVTGDRELLSKVCSLIWPGAVAIVVWGGGSSVLEVLGRIPLDDGGLDARRSQRR
jgi:hypothetical protein